MLKEFRDFAMRGNVVDLAVGVIIGAAFGKIVESMVGDLFMPVLGAVTGGLDFSNYFTPLSAKPSTPTTSMGSRILEANCGSRARPSPVSRMICTARSMSESYDTCRSKT